MSATQFHHKPGAFRSAHHQIIPARSHSYIGPGGHRIPVVTLEDRLAFREKVHIGDKIRLQDVGIEGNGSQEIKFKDGYICEMYPHLVVVQVEAYKISFTYDQLMLHDQCYLVGDEDYIVRRIEGNE